MKGFEAIETEQDLLGLMMVNPNIIASCQWLNDDDFAEPLHGRLFAAIMLQYSQGTLPTPYTLARKFENDPALENIDGKKYLFNLAKRAINMTDVAGSTKELRECATKRNLLAVCQETIAKLTESSGVDDEPEKHLNDTLSKLDKLQDNFMEKRLISSQQVVAEIIEGFKKQPKVYDTGFKTLNAAMGGGLIQGRSYGFGARMKMGKTALLATLAQNLNRNGVNVLYVALEMGSEQIMQRILGRELGINPNEFLKKQTNEFQDRVAAKHREMPDNLYFLDMAGIDFTRLKTMLTSFVRRKKIQVVIIDYWQLIGGKDNRQNEAVHLDMVAQWIAEFSKAEKVASITASQINQQGNTRGGEGIKLAFDQVYALQDCEVANFEYRYLEMMSTRYTQWLSLGTKEQPAFYIEPNGVYFKECEKSHNMVEIYNA